MKAEKGNSRDSVTVDVSADERPDAMIKRFSKKFRNSGLMQELMDRRFYQKPSVRKKMKAARANATRRTEEKRGRFL